MVRAAERKTKEKPPQETLRRRTFGCLLNHEKKFCLFQNFFRELNNLLQKQKSHFFVGAVGCSLALPIRAKLAYALRSSSSPKSHSVAIFGNPFRALCTARAVRRKKVNFGHLYNNQTARSKATPFRRSSRLLSRFALKRQSSHARSAPPLPKNLTSLRFLRTLFSALNLPHTCGFLGKSECAQFFNRRSPYY